MNILLIQPRMMKRPMDTALKTRMAPSLALLTIANLLRDHHVVIRNENIEALDYSQKPEIVGITVTVDVMTRAAEISRRFREKGVFVAAGGIHITANPGSAAPYFDAVLVGAAEKTWPSLVEDIQKGRPRKVYTCAEPLRGAEIIPPRYDFPGRSKYLYVNIVSTSRGCPYRCDFCYNSGENRQPYVNRPVEDVLADVRAIGSRHIMFIDDNFIGNPVWTRALLKKLAPMRLKWNAAVSSNIVHMPDLLDEMKASGCQSLFIGFESLSGASLAGVNKKQNNTAKYEKLVRALHSRGIMINASFVFGLDGDDASTFQSTLRWLIDNKIETVTSHILTPFPGTKLYDELLRQNRIVDHDLSHYNTAHVVFQPKNMTAQELYDGYIGLYKELYSFRNIVRRLPEAKNQRIPYLAFNFLYRKFRRFSELLCRLFSFNGVGRFAKFISYRL